MPPREMSVPRRSRSPKGKSESAVRTRSRSPPSGHQNDPSRSEIKADAAEVEQTLSNVDTGPEKSKIETKRYREILPSPRDSQKPPSNPTIADSNPLFVEPTLADSKPLFVEIDSKDFRGVVTCKSLLCGELIARGSYRLASYPPIRKRPDHYHIECFEKIFDFSQSDMIKRLQPLTLQFASVRGLSERQIRKRLYLVDEGAERLVLKWKEARSRLLNATNGVQEAEVEETRSPASIKIGIDAGSGSDGPGDEAEWSLFDNYLTVGDVEDRYALSQTLKKWELDKTLVMTPEDKLSDKEKQARRDLGVKATEAINTLAAVSKWEGLANSE